MFAYPLASPLVVEDSGEIDYQVAYLQAVFPNQSETSRYHLALMDRDGSNRRVLFPPEGKIGMEPLKNWGAWSPQKMTETQSYFLAIIYQGNLFFVDAATGQAQQITADGLTSRVAWK